MKSAMQELIEELTKKGRNTINGSYLNLIDNNVFSIEVREIFKIYLEKEKKQIIDAYEAGVWDLGCKNNDSKKYYEQTYK